LEIPGRVEKITPLVTVKFVGKWSGVLHSV
jgi:hypothetical protein